MAKIFGEKKNAVILVLILTAAATIACFAGVTAYATYEDRAEAEQLAARQAVTGAGLEAAKGAAIHATRSAADVPQEDLEQEEQAPPEETADGGTVGEPVPEAPVPEAVQDYAVQQPTVQESYAAPAAATTTAPAPETSPAPPAEVPQTWVVTKPAWTEQVPIYEKVYRRICNGCGGDITGIDPTVHMKSVSEAQKLLGCGGWHSEYSEVLTGYYEAYHPEEGYWQ